MFCTFSSAHFDLVTSESTHTQLVDIDWFRSLLYLLSTVTTNSTQENVNHSFTIRALKSYKITQGKNSVTSLGGRWGRSMPCDG